MKISTEKQLDLSEIDKSYTVTAKWTAVDSESTKRFISQLKEENLWKDIRNCTNPTIKNFVNHVKTVYHLYYGVDEVDLPSKDLYNLTSIIHENYEEDQTWHRIIKRSQENANLKLAVDQLKTLYILSNENV